MTAERAPVRFVWGDHAETDTYLAVLNESYSTTRFTRDWYDWKHHGSPFGPSRIMVAEGPDGIEGVAFGLPWTYSSGGEPVPGSRTVDGGTLPIARGRRVLGGLISLELSRWDPDGRPGVIVATATDTARRSHEKNGALLLDRLTYAYCVPPLGRGARLRIDPDVVDSVVPSADLAMGTHWTPHALRWRMDPRSGHDYAAASLQASDGPNGIVYRVMSRRGLRTLVPIVTWGSERERAALLTAVARDTRALAVLAPCGAGAAPLPLRPVRSAGHAWVCAWDRRRPVADHARSGLARLDGWSLGYGELEGLV